VHGSPLIWKELRFYFSGTRFQIAVRAAAVLGVLLFCYVTSAAGSDLSMIQPIYIVIYFLIGAIVTAALAANTVSAERESRALGMLLSLPVSDWHIILAKVLGVTYRALPVWGLLATHLLVFTAWGYVHPIALLHLPAIAISTAAFLTGLGLYFSTWFRSGTSAAVATFVTMGGLWVAAPIATGLASEESFVTCWRANPVVQAVVATVAASDEQQYHRPLGRLEYAWGPVPGTHAGEATAMILQTAVIQGSLGLLCAWRARRRLRRCSFEDSQ